MIYGVLELLPVVAAGRENEGNSGETRVVWTEAGTIRKVTRDGGGVEAKDGGPYAGEGSGRPLHTLSISLFILGVPCRVHRYLATPCTIRFSFSFAQFFHC